MTKDEALDLALEALEFFKGLALSIEEIERAEEAITAIKQARSAPAQEPVAFNAGVPPLYPEMKDGETISVEYTIPPAAQRTWVGLTDEEIDKTPCELYAPDQGGMTMEEGLQVYAKAIEAKLKEKNGGVV